MWPTVGAGVYCREVRVFFVWYLEGLSICVRSSTSAGCAFSMFTGVFGLEWAGWELIKHTVGLSAKWEWITSMYRRWRKGSETNKQNNRRKYDRARKKHEKCYLCHSLHQQCLSGMNGNPWRKTTSESANVIYFLMTSTTGLCIKKIN